MKTARIFTDDLNRIIAATKDFRVPQSDTMHEEFKYIKLEFDAESSIVTAIALDGYKLSVEQAVISNCDESFVAYIKATPKFPVKQYATLSMQPPEAFATNCEEELVIRCDEFSYGFKQPKIINPHDWKKFLPTDQPAFRIGFNANYLLDALKAAKASCGSAFNAPIVLEFTKPLSPVVFRANRSDNIKFVLPIRLKD